MAGLLKIFNDVFSLFSIVIITKIKYFSVIILKVETKINSRVMTCSSLLKILSGFPVTNISFITIMIIIAILFSFSIYSNYILALLGIILRFCIYYYYYNAFNESYLLLHWRYAALCASLPPAMACRASNKY